LVFPTTCLMQNRSGLILRRRDLTQTDGHAKRRAAADRIHRQSPCSTRQLAPGADKAFDTAGFVADLRRADITAHIVQKSRYSALNGRASRHKGYALSIRHRERIDRGRENQLQGI
jgi:hypothetical protein